MLIVNRRHSTLFRCVSLSRPLSQLTSFIYPIQHESHNLFVCCLQTLGRVCHVVAAKILLHGATRHRPQQPLFAVPILSRRGPWAHHFEMESLQCERWRSIDSHSTHGIYLPQGQLHCLQRGAVRRTQGAVGPTGAVLLLLDIEEPSTPDSGVWIFPTLATCQHVNSSG